MTIEPCQRKSNLESVETQYAMLNSLKMIEKNSSWYHRALLKDEGQKTFFFQQKQ